MQQEYKSTLKWYKLERMRRGISGLQSQEVVRLLFRLRTDLACLLEDNKKCKMIIDERYVMYESGAGEDVKHLLATLENLRGIGGYCWRR